MSCWNGCALLCALCKSVAVLLRLTVPVERSCCSMQSTRSQVNVHHVCTIESFMQPTGSPVNVHHVSTIESLVSL